MSLAIKIGNDTTPVQGLVYLDATISYGRDYSGKLTEFPIDSGASISDHFISENPSFTVEGYLSAVDITGISSQINIGDSVPSNSNSMPSALVVEEKGAIGENYLPQVLAQFTQQPRSVAVTGSVPGEDSIPRTEDLFIQLMDGSYFNQAENRWRNQMVVCTLYELDGIMLKNARINLVMTGYRTVETPEDGEALKVSIDFKQARFATLEKTSAPAKAKNPKKVAGTQKKAQKDATPGTIPDSKDKVTANTPSVKPELFKKAGTGRLPKEEIYLPRVMGY